MNVIEEHKKKELKEALDLMNSAPPESYEQARIHYYTLKEGQGWLRTEKERLATIEVDPILSELTSRFTKINQIPQYNEPTHEIGDEAETRYLHRRFLEEKDKVGVANRLNQLGFSEVPNSWIPYVLDILISLIGLVCVYLLFIKGPLIYSFVKSFFTQTTNTI
jgi:hypothetical protein